MCAEMEACHWGEVRVRKVSPKVSDAKEIFGSLNWKWTEKETYHVSGCSCTGPCEVKL
jgi:hypothetical protein